VSASGDRKKFSVGRDVVSFIACGPELFFCYDGRSQRAFGDEPKVEMATNQDRFTRGDLWSRGIKSENIML
jgi:hypothetical protein